MAPEGVAVPGVTEIDTSTLMSGSSMPRAPRMSIGMLIGTGDEDVPPPTDVELSALAHPDADVRREMLRLELAARLADLERQARAIEAERAGEAQPPQPNELRPPLPGEEPARGEEPSTPGEEPSTPGEEPSTPGEEPSTPGEQPPRETPPGA